ncbi:MAG: type IV toxin-antitoxin system AbiEi family antitoxin domain-containing protein [Rhodothermales bacterium]
MTYTEQVLELARERGVIRGSDLEERGIPRQYLCRLYKREVLDRVGRGLYSLPEVDVTEHHTIAEVARRVPSGVICLISALRFHEMTTQAPYEIWIAIGSKARRPKSEAIPLRIVHMSRRAHEAGVEDHEIEGIPVRIYSPAKTVADCFKFRNKIGLDVALEALRDYRRHPGYSANELWHYAEVCRVTKVMLPYLEAIL